MLTQQPSWLPKFKEFVGNLDDDTLRDFLQVASALRGPDEITPDLPIRVCDMKTNLTGRVRMALFGKRPELYWTYCDVDKPPEFTYDEVRDLLGYHYARHVSDALHALDLEPFLEELDLKAFKEE